VNFIRRIIYLFRLFLLRRILKKSKRKKRVVGYDQARSFILLYELTPQGDHEFLNELVKQLEEDGKKVDLIGFAVENKKSESGSIRGPGHVLTKKSFSWLMRLRDPDLREKLPGQKHDILLDVTSSRSIQMKTLGARLPAAYKVGASHPDFLQIYDLIMEVDEDYPAKDLAKHAIHYLKIIKTPA